MKKFFVYLNLVIEGIKKKKKKWVAASDVGLPARTGSLSRLRLSFGILRTPVNQIVRNWNLYACLYRK